MDGKVVTIRTKDALGMFVLASFSPAVNAAAILSAKLANQAGWVSSLLAALLYCGLILLASRFFVHGERRGLYDVFRMTLGRTAGNVLNAAYLVWVFVLVGLYVRIFAERFSSSIFPNSPKELFIISVLMFCYIFLSGPFNNFVKMAAAFSYLVMTSLILIFFAQLSQVRLANFFPVTTLDALPIVRGIYQYLGMFCFFTFLLFFADELEDTATLKPFALKGALWMLAVNQIIFFVTVGVFGSKLTPNMTLPFFMSVKTIQLFDSIERLESLFILLWVMTDIALIMMLMYTFLRLLGKVFHVHNALTLKSPLILGCYVFAMYIAGNIFEVMRFSQNIVFVANVALGFIVPGAVAIVYRIRFRGGDGAAGRSVDIH